MKKIISLILTITFILLFCGCADTNAEKTEFGQRITIVKMPSPPKCKTTNDISIINEIMYVLGQIEKKPNDSEELQGGWSIMVKLDIDGQQFYYTVGGVFTDSDGKQYYVENQKEIEDKMIEIYNKIDAPEVDYP